MLVLTRRPNERVVFPSLGITIHILKSTKAAVRVGIEAPLSVPVLREELCSESGVTTRKSDHGFANALSRATLAVHLAQKQLDAGRSRDAEATLKIALASLEALEESRRCPTSTQRLRALIVEDDVNERELLAGLLSMNGCECNQASDGEDALSYLDAGGEADIVLLDMSMPRCDGPATLRRIRADERHSRLKVFSVSSTSPRELGIAEGPQGFDAWFSKPLNPRRLWDVMQETLHGRHTAN